MEMMVGEWTFTGKEGDRAFSGRETIRRTNNGTAIIQEGYFDRGGGKKEHYVILSGWDGDQKKVLVRGFTSEGFSWVGSWTKLQDHTWIGTASENQATFEVKRNSMRYEESGEGTPWLSEFKRVRKAPAQKASP
ncbi:MAG TPA: hypothetical protein DDW52_30265 [Planctomycetaceae bacterium]|nr:hypothetical protein [Planctomycetaceae bacterium]